MPAPATRTERAAILADELRELADAAEAAARGDERAKRHLRLNLDRRTFALVVGAGLVEELIACERCDCDPCCCERDPGAVVEIARAVA